MDSKRSRQDRTLYRPIAGLIALALAAAVWPEVTSGASPSPLGTSHGIPALKGTAGVLLVDDDDNNPDVVDSYADVLDALAIGYDVWDTDNSDDMEPAAADLAAYDTVIWFSGAAFTDPPPGVAGPGATGEAALAAFLDAGGCLLLSSQDYLFDHGDENLTAFMTDRLGVADFVDEANFDAVTGVGLFAGIGPSTLEYTFDNYSDELVLDATAEPAFFGSVAFFKGEAPPSAALAKAEGASRATFWSFPFEALPDEDREPALSAFFAWCASHLLEVTLAGPGAGTVTSSPAGIDCGTDCSETYDPGTEVTLTATPGAGATFAGWSGGGCTGTGTCVVTLDDDLTVTATFDGDAVPDALLTVNKTGSGSGTVTSAPAGVNCGEVCFASFAAGTSVTLTAVAGAGSTFAGWSGGGCAGTGTCVVTLDADTEVLATFDAEIQDVSLTVTRTGAGSGTVTSVPPGIACGADCSETYPPGTLITLTAAVDAGSTFAGWSGAGCAGTGTCVFILDADTSVAAAFATGVRPATLTVTRTGTGSGLVTSSPAGIQCGEDCSGLYPRGLHITLTAAAFPASVFTGWSGGGCSGTGTCEVVLGADTDVAAAFAVDGPAPTLTVSRTGAGSGTVTSEPAGILCGPDCSEAYPAGTPVILTAAADPGSTFRGWSGDCGGGGSCAVTLAGARTVRAIFDAEGPYPTLTVHRAGAGSGTVTSAPAGILCGDDCSQSYAPGTAVSLTAIPAPGSRFAGWRGDCGGRSCTVALSSYNPSVTAIFDRDEDACRGALCLGDGDRFQIDVEWRTPQGEAGAATAVPFRSADSGLLWFFTDNNWEMLVKVLDGCSLTQHFWVFAAAGTNLEYTLTVTDTVTGSAKSYFNPQGEAAASIVDTAALAVCDAPKTAASFRVLPDPPPALTGELAKQGGCAAGPGTLCLGEGRFAVEVDWRTTAGGSGPGRVVPLPATDSGLFYFFTANNWEMLVKVLDDCAVSGRFWVFATAVTDSGYALRVTDTETGQVREYVNPAGQSATAITDVEAFATCP